MKVLFLGGSYHNTVQTLTNTSAPTIQMIKKQDLRPIGINDKNYHTIIVETELYIKRRLQLGVVDRWFYIISGIDEIEQEALVTSFLFTLFDNYVDGLDRQGANHGTE